MMFSSNQVLEVSGTFDQLAHALCFAINYCEENEKDLVFQTTEDGKYCIGWKPESGPAKGWQDFQFDYDSGIVAKIIIQFLQKQKYKESPYEYFDGSTNEGFIMKNIPETFSDEYEGIKNPFYGIISFETFTNFYSK